MNELKIKFKKVVGLSDYQLSDSEFSKIGRLIESLPKSGRTIASLQKIVTIVTGEELFIIKESYDNSDINNLIDQIIDTLKNPS
ncbi:hypothetical protein [Psychroserpens burtonensis]|uniref:hypothetical protein n=1 Tax=Psychroserpens burtonensis TaxID=49278 RepID=UPI00041DE78C|nr:hypothetical protein [Psychroserpens burtonensis]